jgi:hypothetical protein
MKRSKNAPMIMSYASCAKPRMTFWAGGEDGRRATDFAEGKRWVGLQLRRIEKLRPDHRDETAPLA